MCGLEMSFNSIPVLDPSSRIRTLTSPKGSHSPSLRLTTETGIFGHSSSLGVREDMLRFFWA